MSDTQREISFKEPKKRKSIFKRWWFWVVVLIIGFAALGNSKDDKPAVTSSGDKTVSSQPAKVNPEDKEYKVGETIQLGDNKVTVNNVTKTNGGEFDKPKDGQEFVIVEVTIENAGKKNISYNPFDFKMLNSQGQLVDQAFSISDSSTHLNNGELTPNGKVTGTIPFEMPKGDPKLQLQYKVSFFSNKVIKINLQ